MCSQDEKTKGETLKLRLILLKKRRKEDKQKPKVNCDLWAAPVRPNVQTLSLKSGWDLEKNRRNKNTTKYNVQETMESQPPRTEGYFVLGAAPGRPNVQTLSLEPGPG